MRILSTVIITMLVAAYSLSAAAQQAALFDELTPLYPDSDTASGVISFTSDTPRGVPAGLHVLMTGLPAGASVRLDFRLDDHAVEDVDAYRLIDVPVEQNTGLVNRTERWDGKQNPHVIRDAPFRVFEVRRFGMLTGHKQSSPPAFAHLTIMRRRLSPTATPNASY